MVEECIVSIRMKKIGLNLLPKKNYNIKFRALCESDDGTTLSFQLISQVKLSPIHETDVIHHEGKKIMFNRGGKDYVFSLATDEITGYALNSVESFLIINPDDPKNTYITITDLEIEQEDARVEDKKFEPKKLGITLVSTWEINCGIAIYTRDLLNSLNSLDPFIQGLFTVHSINKDPYSRISGTIVHLQNELGIMPKPPEINPRAKVIITWHTVPTDMKSYVASYESRLNVVAHIVMSEAAAQPIKACSNKDVYVIPIGSMQIPQIQKNHARQLLGLGADRPIGFVFGFQSTNKKYQELIDAAKRTRLQLVISGAKNDNASNNNVLPKNSNDVIFINRYLSEPEVSLYALASDVLLFDYQEQKHFSSSAAMHRIIGAGRPVICSNIRHFSELTDGKNALKFISQSQLEQCILRAVGPDSMKLGTGALEYAEATLWPKIAEKHMAVYRKYVEFGNKEIKGEEGDDGDRKE